MRRLGLAALAMMAASPVIGQAPALPPGPGHDTLVKVCSACHAPEIAATERHSAAEWATLVDTMIGRGATATPAETAQIKAYLSRSFPAKAKARTARR